MEFIAGEYCSVRDKDVVDFYVKAGLAPESMAEKMVGSNWRMRIFDCGDQRFVWHMTCQELPELNMFNSLTIGKETTSFHKGMGGDVKTICTLTEDKDLRTVMTTPKYGTIEFLETYTPDGVKMVMKDDKGDSCCGFWRREVDLCGTFVYDKGENIKEFSEQSMFEMRPSYSARVEHCGDKIKVRESLGGGEGWVTSCKLGEEVDIDLFGTSIKMLITKEGNNLKFVGKTPKGEEECLMEFSTDGMKMTCKTVASGISCTVWNKRVVDMSGTYRLVTHDIPEGYGELIGVTTEELKKVVEDETARTIIEVDEPVYKFKMTSQYTPTAEASFKLGEEFEFSHPVFEKLKFKAVPTRKDNIITMNSKFDNFEAKANMVFKNGFMVKILEIVGKDMEWAQIFDSCCC